MVAKNVDNELTSLFFTLRDAFESDNCNEGIDDIALNILLNNGSSYIEDVSSIRSHTTKIDEDSDYYVMCIKGMIGPTRNNGYDFFIFNGARYLVIYVDYFDFIKEEDPLGIKDNGIYYLELKKIVDLFYDTYYCINLKIDHCNTAYSNIRNRNCSIIAASIINLFKDITQEEIPDMEINEIKKIMEMNFINLYGVLNL